MENGDSVTTFTGGLGTIVSHEGQENFVRVVKQDTTSGDQNAIGGIFNFVIPSGVKAYVGVLYQITWNSGTRDYTLATLSTTPNHDYCLGTYNVGSSNAPATVTVTDPGYYLAAIPSPAAITIMSTNDTLKSGETPAYLTYDPGFENGPVKCAIILDSSGGVVGVDCVWTGTVLSRV